MASTRADGVFDALDEQDDVGSNPTSEKARKCSSCGDPIKGHLGPYGPSKCLRGLVNTLSARVDDLESECRDGAERLRSLEVLSGKRQEALLATINGLEEEVRLLEEKSCAIRIDRPLVGKASCSANLDTTSPDSANAPANIVSEPERTSCTNTPTTSQPRIRMLSDIVRHSLGTAKPVKPTHQEADAHRDPRPPTSSDASSYSGSEPKKDHTIDDGFQLVQPKNRRTRTDHTRTSQAHGGPKTIAARLKGAQRVYCKPFHLSGLNEETTEISVRAHCRLKNVTVTGCYEIPTKQWGTKSMKVFIDKQSESAVLADGFWPELIRCRLWQKEPPRNRHNLAGHPSGGLADPQQ